MKKSLLLIAPLAVFAASCDPSSKDSYQTISYAECNLISDTQNDSEPAQASYASYKVKFNITQNTVDVSATDVIISNQKYSFETDPMEIKSSIFTIEGDQKVEKMSFSKSGQTAAGSSASDLDAYFAYCYVPATNNLMNPDLQIAFMERLDIKYNLGDRYHVQSFWPNALYKGHTYVSGENETLSSRESFYIVQIDMEKKTGEVFIYKPEMSLSQPADFPKIIRIEGLPVVFSHDSYSLSADAPKTTVLGTKDNASAFVEKENFNVADFKLQITSSDLTEVGISYQLDGKTVNFNGCSILKSGR